MLTIIKTEEININDFVAWSGGEDTLENIREADMMDELQAHLEDIFYEGLTSETQLNDYLWFEDSYIYEALGLNEDGEIPEDDEEEGE